MLNKTLLIGRLVKDPELKKTPSGKDVASATIAVQRNFKNAQGEKEADYFNLILWNQQAVNFSNWLKKGQLVNVNGHLQNNNYENSEGQKVYQTNLIVEDFYPLEKTNQGQNTNSATQDDNLPF
ncbi:single-stranded DNA-binding protein [Streptococcus gordonii]|jgi:single-strand DNA-binding protein|uniref:single-stranded DNA-binding protein n=1 Tax=Streptococcus gordonii TaxID=1302 RepID=UPI001CC17E0D|nr:single-stranded DNA-binding protein [Streptococcus gordonii]MBZ2142925.1 single-stranded DNA-binding protein [Streptococcus gordonii]MBZ2144976.1 single-stranded DNA-binding protein [Streptococcus gordonii]